MKSIYCCIVDDHCDIIPFLFSCYKFKKISLTSNLFFHIDSHPDLIPPQTNINNYQNIELLYNILDNQNGISEFILPLIINKHINYIIWLHQNWSKQFQNDGNNFFILGNNIINHLPCVNLHESYYYDEGIVYSIDEIKEQNNVPFYTITNTNFERFLQDIPSLLSSINSSNLSNLSNSSTTSSTTSSTISSIQITQLKTSWILDICLDYFTVSNPFLLDLEQHLKETSEISMKNIIESIQDMFNGIRFRSNDDNSTNNITLSERRNERVLFLSLITDILTLPNFPSLESTCCTQFLTLFDSNKQHLAQLFLQVMSTLSFETRKVIYELDIIMIATLPHHPVEWNEIELSIQQLKGILQTCVEQFQSIPQAICIARSDGDKYTNPELVDQIQESLISMLNNLFDNKLEIYDIREDCYVKCHQLFRIYDQNDNISSRKRKLLEDSGYKF